jgi:hypothetical protein
MVMNDKLKEKLGGGAKTVVVHFFGKFFVGTEEKPLESSGRIAFLLCDNQNCMPTTGPLHSVSAALISAHTNYDCRDRTLKRDVSAAMNRLHTWRSVN